jgi:hypothetical protein
MLMTPFTPLSDADFRLHVASGQAVPSQVGNSLFVAKWEVQNQVDPDVFLAGLKRLGMRMMVRTYSKDVNIRVVKAD